MRLLLLFLAGAVALLLGDKDECPPCFNCNIPGMECTHFGDCDSDLGICTCPEGFGGSNCSEPACGSPARTSRRPIRGDEMCNCDDGWYGINCNMCGKNSACDALMPADQPGTCYNGGLLVSRNYHECNVTNRKIRDTLKDRVPQVTFGCERNYSTCNFQFWIDGEESFFCKLEECDFDIALDEPGNGTEYDCEKIKCECVPNRTLCGANGSIDISEWLLKSIKGPGSLTCQTDGTCAFSEPEMNKLIQFTFGDHEISLECTASECMHYSQVPGFAPYEPQVSKIWVACALFLVLVTLTGTAFGSKRVFNSSITPVSFPRDSVTQVQAVPVSLEFRDIFYKVKGQTVLQGISGAVSPGSVLAIMGGSGAGKTTLLDILARKNKMGHVGGEVYCNGSSIPLSKFQPLAGYVDQDDELLSTLTVYETVSLSALLRLPRSMSTEAKRLRALDTLAELGILHIKDRLIGDESKRGISGGEKRRVAIACELVTSPSILYLDEPTSGLDAFNAFNVVESLVTLAKSHNRTVIFTIHQPRSNIVSLFDHLLLLGNGQMVFSGTPQEAITHFNELGHRCPPGYNLADFLIDLTMRASQVHNGDTPVETSLPQEAEEDCLDPEIHQNPLIDDPVRSWQDLSYHREQIERATAFIGQGSEPLHGLEPLVRSYKASTYFDRIQRTIRSANESAHTDFLDAVYQRPGVWRQFLLLSQRTFKNLYRNPMLVLTHYCISVALGLFCGLLYYQVSLDISGFQNRLGLFFFLLALFGFSTLTTLSLFSQERVVFVRERANGYYSPIAYYCAKVLLDIIPLRVLPPVLLGFIVYPLVGLNFADNAPFKFLLILVLFNLAAASIMLLIGILIKDTGVATLTGCLVNLFGILFAGLFLNQESMPAVTSWMKYLSIFHYAYEALSVNEVRYLSLSETKFGLHIEVPGATILSAFGFNNEAITRDISGLGAIAALGVVLGYLAIHFCLMEQR